MKICVILKMVPDLVYKIEVDETKKSLDKTQLRYTPSEVDDHAIEQALILKEKYGGTITLLALDAPDIDKKLFVYLAKGIDQVIKLTKDDKEESTFSIAKAIVPKLQNNEFDILLLGVYAHDELDGELGPYISSILNLPYMGVVTGISIDEQNKVALIKKAYSGGLEGEFEVLLPAIAGIQSAEKPPRYISLTKVRKVRKTANIEIEPLTFNEPTNLVEIIEMNPPPELVNAEIIEGSVDDIVIKVADILQNEGLI